MNAPDTAALKPAISALQHELEKELDRGPKATLASFHEVEGFIRNGERMLELARRCVIELEMAYGQKRRQLANRVKDEMHKLEAEHEAKLERVNAMIARLEALRHG